MATIKAEYYRLNGGAWDKYYFKTTADMVENIGTIGQTVVQPQQSLNIDDKDLKGGIYSLSQMVGTWPFAPQFGVLINAPYRQGAGNRYGSQIAMGDDYTAMAIRSQTAGGWNPWKKVLLEGDLPEIPEDIITESDYGIVQSFTIEDLRTATFKAPVIYNKSGQGGFMNFEIEVFGAGRATNHTGKVKMVCAVQVGGSDGNVLYPSNESDRARIVEFQGPLSTEIFIANPEKDGDFVTFQITRRRLQSGIFSPRVIIRTVYTGGTPDDYNNRPLDTRWEVTLSPHSGDDTRLNKLYYAVAP